MRFDHLNLSLLGFGEAATAFASGWNRNALERISAFDVKVLLDDGQAVIEDRCRRLKVSSAPDLETALQDAQIVISLVTADQSEEAAKAAASCLAKGVLFIDGNSCSPKTKGRSAEAVSSSAADYVDMAIMAPVHPHREKTPVLLSGPQAYRAERLLTALGMNVRVVGDRVGQASAIKLTRSVMVKGMEALFAECFLAARRGGVEEEVIRSLETSDPDIEWRKRLSYILQRTTQHGVRRAAEMSEAAAMVADLGLPSVMSRGSVEWQALLGNLPVEAQDAGPVLEAMGLSPEASG